MTCLRERWGENESLSHPSHFKTNTFSLQEVSYEKTISSYNAHNNNDIQPGGQR